MNLSNTFSKWIFRLLVIIMLLIIMLISFLILVTTGNQEYINLGLLLLNMFVSIIIIICWAIVFYMGLLLIESLIIPILIKIFQNKKNKEVIQNDIQEKKE